MNHGQFNRSINKLRRQIEREGYRENLGQEELRQYNEWLYSQMTDGIIDYPTYAKQSDTASRRIDAL